MKPNRQELIHVLAAAGAAHHEYEANYLNGARDEQWTGWYAAFVIGRIGTFTTPTQLTRWLESTPNTIDKTWAESAADHIRNQFTS